MEGVDKRRFTGYTGASFDLRKEKRQFYAEERRRKISIRSISHKGLRHLYKGKRKGGIDPELIEKAERFYQFLIRQKA